jgi:hypothetical protein
VSDNKTPSRRSSDATLVGGDALSAAMRDTAPPDKEDELELGLIDNEPLLSEYCQNEFMQILGRLALAGAGPGIIRGVATDMHRVITVSAKALRMAYCELLEDFLPDLEETASPAEERPAPPDNEP